MPARARTPVDRAAAGTRCPQHDGERRVEAAQTFDRDRAREMAVDGADEGDGSARPVPGVERRSSGAQKRSAQSFERVVDRHRRRILHEHRRLAAAARALPYGVAVEERRADPARVGDEAAQRGEVVCRFGDPVGEVAHQLGLVRDRQLLESPAARVAAGEEAAVERRTAARRLEKIGQAPVAASRERLGRRLGGGPHIGRHAGGDPRVVGGQHGWVSGASAWVSGYVASGPECAVRCAGSDPAQVAARTRA